MKEVFLFWVDLNYVYIWAESVMCQELALHGVGLLLSGLHLAQETPPLWRVSRLEGEVRSRRQSNRAR